MDDRLRLRHAFGRDAERYDRARPGYPATCSMPSQATAASAPDPAYSRSGAAPARRPGCREGLLDCLAAMIGGGRVTKSYVFQLRMARRRPR